MTLCQRFREGKKVELLAVRKDKITGNLYNRVADVRMVFPGASLFKVNGVVLFYLEDENERVYEPKRIAHHPNDTIDVVAADPLCAAKIPPVCPHSLTSVPTNLKTLSHPRQLLSNQHLDHAVSKIFMQSAPIPITNAFDHTSLQPIASPNIVSPRAASFARPMAKLSVMALDITQLRQQLEHSTDRQSVHHQQQMQQLIDMVRQQNEMVAQMNEMLKGQAASKEREEKMLQEQAESRLREEQMLTMQQETIDRLIVNQQRVDAILSQNYELHEYPIPRLFVILPDSFSDWDPRNFLMERFRLHFLCECGDNCGSSPDQDKSSGHLRITAADSLTPIPVKNSIHLAKHEGYELSRPTEFFDRYGPYVLGMLRILQHCLAVAVVAAPVATLADNGLKDIMDGIKSISMSTVEAVNMSINILETKLGDTDVAGGFARTAPNGQEDNTIFENLAALEGADLRRLDTFLRNNDKDKILGNLYRITTEHGHIKWVCLEHYQEKYRATALASFIQSVETAGGAYDPHLGQVTISLKSSTASKDFFRRLVSHAPAVQTLDVTLDWNFGSADLVTLVDMVAKSNVKVVKLDLQDDYTSNQAIISLRLGKGRYHSLLGLLSNTKLRSLHFSNLYLLATRTSNLSSNFSASWLQSFQFFGRVNIDDRIRLTNIISRCSQLVDLRLVCQGWGPMDYSLQHAALSFKNLRRLHVSSWRRDEKWDGDEGNIPAYHRPMTEVICTNMFKDSQYLTKVVRQSSVALETLVLYPGYGRAIDITSEPASFNPHLAGFEDTSSQPLHGHLHLSALTHLDIQERLTDGSLQYLSAILPRLDLVHFGCSQHTQGLLRYCNLASLKSLSILGGNAFHLVPILDAMIGRNATSTCGKLEQLFLQDLRSARDVPTKFLQSIPLTRLFLDRVDSESLALLLGVVEFSKLEEISIRHTYYLASTERVLAKRISEFPESLVIQLDWYSSKKYIDDGGESRTTEGSPELLPRHRVARMLDDNIEEHHYRFLQPILPVYTF
ncbi:hypothetical protein BGZ96_009132 [Linnemannia gamsii]|uniref:RNI-like protein n=1 Tax=Linnemannia gamsii TaxID=64522 RepID=A0ABQ7KCN3_9FUNG|nr:hypothetical protein BGZ96_009132 [Linnemannia gamsii]